MKLTITTLLAFCLYTASVFAQSSYSIKGTAVDTSSKVKLVNTTICVLNAKDSIMRKFVYAGEDGHFAITGLPAGKFILLMSYPTYADYVEAFTLDEKNPTVDFSIIYMQLKTKILQEVMIKAEVIAVKIKGDTTEFNAKAYVIQPNDKVEDLLKQLPGIQVDKDGKITANGKTVSKVLVDGEEFFGDDPTLVTKNLRADMVDKVQLYDKKSDQAAFTGIDDGKTTKTINIKLKEDKKNGTFGKLTGGIGTDGYYEGQAIFNRFKAKEKYSVYGTTANDGKTGLGFSDNTNIGASNVQVGDDGGLFITGNNDALDSFNGTYDGRGQPLARTGGVHFDNKFGADMQTLNTNYKIGSLSVDGNTATTTQQTLPTGSIYTNSNQTFNNYAFRQKLDAAYQVKLDTSTTLKIAADATFKNFKVGNDYNTNSRDSLNRFINKQVRSVTNNGDQQVFDASAFFTKKLHKVGRTFSWNVSEAYNKNTTDGYLKSETDFFNKAGAQDSAQIVNQYKTTNTISSALNSNITYSEPLSKGFAVLFNYGFAINNSTADKKSFNQSATGVYNILDNVYSNDYKFNQLTNQFGAVFNYKSKKVIFNLGAKASDVNFKQVDQYTGNVYKRDFINWLPQARFSYMQSQQKSFTLYYNGNTSQPTIDQIQPVRVNTDPLNIVLGNANLKPSFSNNFSFDYNESKIISGANTYLDGSYSFRSNAIVNNTVTDITSGKTTTQYTNLAGKTPYNYYLYFYTGRKIKPSDISIGINLNTNGNISYSYINNQLNMSKSYSYGASLSLSKYIAQKYSFSAGGGPQYTINEFSLQNANSNNASGANVYLYSNYYLPAKFVIASDIRYSYTAKTQALPQLDRTIWNASIYKTFLKDDHLRLTLSANDLLNQNVNFNRNITGNSITQTSTTGIKRYIMFSVQWDFTKFGTEPTKTN
jgi:hypothetical protein